MIQIMKNSYDVVVVQSTIKITTFKILFLRKSNSFIVLNCANKIYLQAHNDARSELKFFFKIVRKSSVFVKLVIMPTNTIGEKMVIGLIGRFLTLVAASCLNWLMNNRQNEAGVFCNCCAYPTIRVHEWWNGVCIKHSVWYLLTFWSRSDPNAWFLFYRNV